MSGESIRVGKMVRCHVCLEEKNNAEECIYHIEGSKEAITICMSCIIVMIKWVYYNIRKDEIRKPWWSRVVKFNGVGLIIFCLMLIVVGLFILCVI